MGEHDIKTTLTNEGIIAKGEEHEPRRLSRPLKIVVFVLTLIGIGASVSHLWGFSIAGNILWTRAYYSLLIACFLPILFLTAPYRRGAQRPRWFDYVLSVLIAVSAMYIFFNAKTIEFAGWEYVTPVIPAIIAFVIVFVLLEGARRSAGLIFLLACLFFLSLPMFTQYLPGFLKGVSFGPAESIAYYVYSTEAVYGIPMKVMGELLIGFLVFAVALQHMGGGKFFLDLAFSLVGSRRGGPAKVAVVASGFFGSLSGSVIANVTTTGAITIPAMKKLGYPATYAGAIEACASTGGVLMPPVMGATVFIMAEVLGISYATIVIAAFIPAILYYLSLILQVDAYAARKGLVGLPKENLPRLLDTLKEGWPYLFSLAFLVFEIFYLRIVTHAPYHATALLLATVMVRKSTRLNMNQLAEFVIQTGKTIGLILASLIGVGFIIGSLMVTGVALSFSHEVINLAGDNIALLLVLGAGVSFILGMGLTITACYVLLALTMAPPLVAVGYDPLAVHLFVLYCGMLSFITPPVALAAFAASALADSSPIKTGFTAMRLGYIMYVVPFVFVITPSLIFRGPIVDMLYHFTTFVIGIFFITAALEGYLLGYGILRRLFSWRRILSLVTGLLLIIPETYTNIIGFVLLLVYLVPIIRNRLAKPQQPSAYQVEDTSGN